MGIRWFELVIVAALLGLSTMSCLPPDPPPEVESGSSAGEAPLDQPGAGMEEQADQGELTPAHEVAPGAQHN